MSPNFKNVINEVKYLNANERALVGHCLISSLETKQDEDVDLVWAELAEKKYNDLISGKVKTVSWEDMKKEIQE